MYFTRERNRALAEKLFEHVRHNSTDMMDELFEYDLSIYSDPDLAVRERERIFERLPMMALHSSQVADPDTFATVRLNRTNVLVTRQKDGSVKALVNVCRHRGAQLTNEEAGKRKLFTCPYHGWAYANDGTLKAITFPETFGAKPCDKRNLVSLPVEERHGFIWIVENPEAEIDVAAHLGAGMDQALSEYRLDDYHCYKTHTFHFPQNWKVMMDGLIDGYHVQFLHGKTISPYFYPNMLGLQQHGHHALWGNPRRRLDDILDEQPGDSPLDRYVIFGNLVSPNSAMVLHPHHIEYWTVYQDPADIGASYIQLRYLTPQKDHDERGHEILEKNWKIATAAIINEDVPVGNSIQDASQMPHTGTITLGRNEIVNQIFHKAYREYISD